MLAYSTTLALPVGSCRGERALTPTVGKKGKVLLQTASSAYAIDPQLLPLTLTHCDSGEWGIPRRLQEGQELLLCAMMSFLDTLVKGHKLSFSAMKASAQEVTQIQRKSCKREPCRAVERKWDYLSKMAEMVVVDVSGKTEQSHFFRLKEGAVCCAVAGVSEGAQPGVRFCTFPSDT